MDVTPRCVLTDEFTSAGATIAAWAARIARATDARVITMPPASKRHGVLDRALKLDVDWLLTELRWPRQGDTRAKRLDAELGLLLRRAPCPVLTVQPWAEMPARPPRVAVVGVVESTDARLAAHAAERVLTMHDEGVGRLVLVHGCEVHPDELAREASRRTLADGMRIDRHRWLRGLAEEVRSSRLAVEIVSEASWAPELVCSTAHAAEADLVALGAATCREADDPIPSPIHRRVVRSIPCPLLTVNERVGGRLVPRLGG